MPPELCMARRIIPRPVSQPRPEMPAGGEFFCEVLEEKLLAEEFEDNGWDLQFMG